MLDESLVGKSVYMRWQKYGWQLGRIYAKLPKDTPCLFNTFNYRVVWADKTKGPAMLAVANYGFGEHATSTPPTRPGSSSPLLSPS